MHPSNQAVVEKLTTIATNLLNAYRVSGVDADDLRWCGAHLLENVPSKSLPAVLTAALKRAGAKPTSETRKSSAPTAKGRRVLIWRLA